MKKYWWILGILVLVFLLWNVREGLENQGEVTDVPKCPDGSTNYKQQRSIGLYCEDTTDSGTDICPAGYSLGHTGDKCYKGDASVGLVEDDSQSVPLNSCPSGTTRIGMKCKKITVIKCPAGSSLARVYPPNTTMTGSSLPPPKCVSDNISNTYPTNPPPARPDPNFKACNGDDSLIRYEGKPIEQGKCLGKPTPGTAATTPAWP